MISTRSNFPALHAANSLNSHYSKLSSSMQRLSSGLRVNSAADDAAGLAIRELMRSDIVALNQGARNANDAISLLQVADSALAIIDEKLIRMKELAEQAATGTYDSIQRLMIASEFQAMGDEIDRIARATDFNGIKLLDGSLSGPHDGKGLKSTGRMKVHFGALNDSAEDYYYIEIADCTRAGLGLAAPRKEPQEDAASRPGDQTTSLTLFDCPDTVQFPYTLASNATIPDFKTVFQEGQWGRYEGPAANKNNFMVLIPQGTKNIVINQSGQWLSGNTGSNNGYEMDNDLQLFTLDGKHLAGTPQDDFVWSKTGFPGFPGSTLIEDQPQLPFTSTDYDPSILNAGPSSYAPDPANLKFTQYSGMEIGYGGDPERADYYPQNWTGRWSDYEVLTIDEAKEDLILWCPGVGAGLIKAYWDGSDEDFQALLTRIPNAETAPAGDVTIETQDKAQKALVKIDEAIVRKDKVRAHLGTLQNRLENTLTNLNIQSENLQNAESRISDADIASEMTQFVRNQILAQSSVAMLGQANNFPSMLMRLLG